MKNIMIKLKEDNKYYIYSKSIMLLNLNEYTQCTMYSREYLASFLLNYDDAFRFLIDRIQAGSSVLAINSYTVQYPVLEIGTPRCFSIVQLIKTMNEISIGFDKGQKGKLKQINQLMRNIIPHDEPLDIAKMILENDDMFSHILNCIATENPLFTVTNYVSDYNETTRVTPRSYSIVELVRLMKELPLDESQKKKFLQLTNLVSIQSITKSFDSLFHEVTVEDHQIKIPVELFIEILTDHKIYTDCLNGNIKYGNYSTAEIFYALIDFINVHQIEVRYELPNVVKSRISNIKNYNNVDCQAIGRVLETKCPDNDKCATEDNKSVIREIPSNYNDLEKSLYIYLSLCKKYNVRDCSQTPDNNSITDLEFLKLFGQLLSSLGINYELKQLTRKQHPNDVMPLSYYLVYRVGKYLINTDIPSTMFNSDYMSVKAGCIPNGIYCLNGNYDTKYEFNEAMDRIKRLFDQINDEENPHILTIHRPVGNIIDEVCLVADHNGVTGILRLIRIKKFFEATYFDDIRFGMAGYIITTDSDQNKNGIILAYQEGDSIQYLLCGCSGNAVTVDKEYVDEIIKSGSYYEKMGIIFDCNKKMKL